MCAMTASPDATDAIRERLSDLPDDVARAIADFARSVLDVFGADVQSIVLFGSAAEGALRPTSDVNVIVVLAAFDPAKASALRAALRTAHAAANLSAMFILRDEIAAAAEAFAQKFADIQRRHRVLHGDDAFAALEIPRAALVTRLNQVLLNLTLRLRAAYVERGMREEQIARVIADVAGPVRTCAANLLALEGDAPPSPKEALERFTRSFGGGEWTDVLSNITLARQGGALPPGAAEHTLTRLIELTERMRGRARGLR
jgi:predicted nucleotidyltransferase